MEGDGKAAAADVKFEFDVLVDKLKENPTAYKVLTKEEYEALLQRPLFRPRISTPLTRFQNPESMPRFSTPGPAGLIPFSPIHNVSNGMSGSEIRPNCSFVTSTLNPPRLPVFSGVEDNQSISYEVWNFEVKCLLKSKQYPEFILLQAIRNSLRGTARNMLVSLGENASVEDILQKLDGFYGNVNTSETMMQSFYNDQQRNESAVVYGSRLEDTLSKALRGRYDLLPAKDIMLKSKFWSGLKKCLKDATRHLHDSTGGFQTLLREVRKVEQELSLEQSVKSSKVAQCSQQTQDSDIKQVVKAIQDLSTRLEKMEVKMTSLQDDVKRVRDSRRYESPNPNFNGQGYQQRGRGGFSRGRPRGNNNFTQPTRGRPWSADNQATGQQQQQQQLNH